METAGIHAATWVVGKALSPLSGGVLEAWAASTNLGQNIEALKLELLHAKAMLNSAQGREIHNPALGQLLDKLSHLAYGADDVLDELDYFRIQDELHGTYHAADVHAYGCVQDLALNARYTARACVNKLKLPVCTRAARRDDSGDGAKQGCLSGLCFCGARSEINSSPSSPTSNVGKHFSCFLLPSIDHDAQTGMTRNDPLQIPKLRFDRVEMSRKILDITEHLKPVCANVHDILSLELLNSSRAPTQDITMSRHTSTPQIIEPKLYGRDSHRKIIVDEIINSECRGLTVLPIVGPGGIGKTTFTQHIYEQMKSHFQVSIWICVSLNFNANRLAKDIVEKIPEVNNENKNCTVEELIEQRLNGKRILLVLDDVWKHLEDEWKKLLALFKKEGAKGNMVVVTTRIPEVANTIKTTKCSLELDRLCQEDIMSFFEEYVFDDQKPWVDYPELVDVGSKIVDKLKGSPLAAKTVGILLRNKLTLNHWRSVLESKEWESQKNDNDIMPALKLSYDYLPFHLKRCFSFCALFPEDYEFGREELVHLWIGLGILVSCEQKKKRMKDVGLCYLNDLVNHGFFKMNEKEDKRPYYVIHDLLHELAVKVSAYECLSIYSSNARDIEISPSVRHLSIIVENTDVENRMSFEDYDGNLSALAKRLKVENLRTLMLFGDYHGSFSKTFGVLFTEARAIRTIFLSGVTYNMEDILKNFSKLVHLRYLRTNSVGHSPLSLPTVLFRLYHLEVIDLQNQYFNQWSFINSIRHMSNLVKMRHFLVPKIRINLHSLIFGVGKLKFFQELRAFRVGKESEGFELSQLGQLTEIGGSLVIYNLEKAQATEAHELKLTQKNHLRQLTLEWDDMRSTKDPVQEEIVLENLVPHSYLPGLCIKGHGGTSCPSWLCTNLSAKHLEFLCLDGVSWKNLPPLGEMWMVNELGEEYQGCSISPPGFHNLKRLELCNISRLTKWVGNGACTLFSHLEILIIKHCSELVELPFSHSPTCCQAQLEEKIGWFPRLHLLEIMCCPMLGSLPPFPWGTDAPCSVELVSVGSGFEELVYPRKYSSKLSLEIKGKGDQADVFWSGLNFSNLTDLEELRMVKIPPLPLDDFQVLTSLKRIVIQGASRVLPPVEGDRCHGLYRFPVEDLEISSCDASGKELTLLISFLPNISKLKIENCENITGLGVVEDAETVCGEQQQQTRVEDEETITAAASEGLLLLPPQIQQLSISYCPSVRVHGGGGGLQFLRSLRTLYVTSCPEFLSTYSSSSSSSTFFPFPTCLQGLTLWKVKHMETLQALSNLTSLTELYLDIQGEGGSRDEGLWPLLAHGSLTKLELHDCSDFFSGSDPSWLHDKVGFSRSCKLFDLATYTSTGVLAVPICSLLFSSLTKLDLKLDTDMARFTNEQEEALQLLTSLQELQFSWGHKLQRLPAGLHKLINLKKLRIYDCSAIQSLPSLPSSLQELEIEKCGAIKSLPNSLPGSLEKLKISGCNAIKSLPNNLPISLEKLYIYNCRAIKSLPKDGLSSSMLELHVHGCDSEEVKRACRKLIGTIPIVSIRA